jgi:sulfate transport system permease protein
MPAFEIKARNPHILPGFSLTMGCTLLYVALFILIPFAALFLKGIGLTWEQFVWHAFGPRAVDAYWLTLKSALIAALINAVFGVWVAWILVRYRFPGKRVMDALVDLPFALPAAVGGIVLAAIFAPSGWVGKYAYELGIQTAYSPIGVTLAMLFVGLPFIVRAVQPVLADIEAEVEEAALTLGAGPVRTFWKIFFPVLTPAILTGFSLALARGIGEYGAVIFISGNIPMYTEVASLIIVIKLDQFEYEAAAAVALVQLSAAFLILLTINLLQTWGRRYQRKI